LKISRVASVAFPNKVLQYLATGIPVVSTRLEGLVSALDGAEGLVWADSPAEVLEIALEKAQSSPSYGGQRIAFDGLAIKFSPESALLSLKATLALAVGRNL
jgi:glycosyltransferase involved in cell wall biosynthesis